MDARKIGLADSDVIRNGNYGVKEVDNGGRSWLDTILNPSETTTKNVLQIALGASAAFLAVVLIISIVLCCKRRIA